MTNKPTSEEIFKLSAQPRQTCPMIDYLISYVDARAGLKGHEKSQIKNDLEAIRQNVTSIRNWGQDWKDDCIRNLETYAPDEHEKYLDRKHNPKSVEQDLDEGLSRAMAAMIAQGHSSDDVKRLAKAYKGEE